MTSIPPPTVPPATPPPPGGGSYTPPPPPPTGGGPGLPPPPAGPASSDRTVMLILSYAWLLSLIPLFTKKDNPEIQWHAKNGLVLAIVITIVDIVFYALLNFMPAAMTCFGWIVPCALGLGYLILVIIAIMKAINGERLRIPVLTEQAEKLNI